jgi:glucose dehydrogenase
MARINLAEGYSALRAGTRWWPAEIVLRGLGLLFLTGLWLLAPVAHRMATTPAPHPAGMADLAVCTVLVVLLCAGLTLTFAGPVLFLDIPLPPHFAHTTSFRR